MSWERAGPSLELPPPVALGPDRQAEASVDETDTYGLRLFGVPVRADPHVHGALVSTVHHGDRLSAVCWAAGDVVTDGFTTQPVGAYTSDVWFRVTTPSGPGFVPDVRFSRRGNTDRLGLPMCAGS
jgi:hypothetical protein